MIIGIKKDINCNIIKTRFMFLWMPIFKKIKYIDNKRKVIKILELTVYNRCDHSMDNQNQICEPANNINEIKNEVSTNNTNTLLEVELLVKAVASGLRDIKRLENKLSNINKDI
ncbi:MAG: hypothetical protein FWE18_03020 [Alphaproteobacteria bacterium]|nr:hypothetical protein [Alphaproteobacteria bacterium]